MNKFLAAIQREEGLQVTVLNALQAGQEGPKMEKKYRDVNQRLRNLIADPTITTEQFLRGVSYNIELSV